MNFCEKPIAVMSWSSGKDSAFALHRIRQGNDISVIGLLTTMNMENDRVSVHGVRKELLDKQMEVLGLPVDMVMLPMPCDNEVYQQKMSAMIKTFHERGVQCVIFGDLFLEDIRQYRVDQMQGTGIKPIFPLWKEDTRLLSRQMVDEGLEAIVTCIDQRVLPAAFAGRRYDHSFLDDLPDGVDPCGENGEFHTVTVSGPMFTQDIAVEIGEQVVRGDFVYTDVMLREGR